MNPNDTRPDSESDYNHAYACGDRVRITKRGGAALGLVNVGKGATIVEAGRMSYRVKLDGYAYHLTVFAAEIEPEPVTTDNEV